MSISEAIKQKAIDLGFDAVGIASAEPVKAEHTEYLRNWLSDGMNAQMEYMQRNFDKRIDPGKLLEGAKSVVCVALNYKPPEQAAAPAGKFGAVANFAAYQDYHGFIKERLFVLAEFMKEISCKKEMKFKACVDSVPVLERALAERAGLGFIGKNHMLINPELGLQLFLGEIITDLELAPDKALNSGCSDCCKCIRACPAGALSTNGSFDANKCISYLTVEHSGQIAAELTEKIGGRVFGCDECIIACPYDMRAKFRANRDIKFYGDRKYLELGAVVQMESGGFEEKFKDSTILRSGLERLKRNAQICEKNLSGHN
jgi:epoxyqueuosine reductase